MKIKLPTISKITRKAVWEMVKEGGRIALFAALASLVAWATDKLSGLDPTSTQVIIGTILIRLLDKYVHENKGIAKDGIAPF